MSEGSKYLHFCCAEPDTLHTMVLLRQLKAQGRITEKERRQLLYMEKRKRDSTIELTPAIIYAAANQQGCIGWLARAKEPVKNRWYSYGIAWMRRYPAFLEKLGWRERKNAVFIAGMLALAEETDSASGWEGVRLLLKSGWRLLWEKMEYIQVLDASAWEEMRQPWADSAAMGHSISGVLIFMALLMDKPVCDRDKLWRDMQKLRDFTRDCLQAPTGKAGCRRDCSLAKDQKMAWLLSRFQNPQRPAYITEKGRIHSEWLEKTYKLMECAGLPVSACETMNLSCQEVQQILDLMDGGRLTERQYMSFMMLYCVARELAKAGQAASGIVIVDKRRQHTAAEGK